MDGWLSSGRGTGQSGLRGRGRGRRLCSEITGGAGGCRRTKLGFMSSAGTCAGPLGTTAQGCLPRLEIPASWQCSSGGGTSLRWNCCMSHAPLLSLKGPTRAQATRLASVLPCVLVLGTAGMLLDEVQVGDGQQKAERVGAMVRVTVSVIVSVSDRPLPPRAHHDGQPPSATRDKSPTRRSLEQPMPKGGSTEHAVDDR